MVWYINRPAYAAVYSCSAQCCNHWWERPLPPYDDTTGLGGGGDYYSPGDGGPADDGPGARPIGNVGCGEPDDPHDGSCDSVITEECICGALKRAKGTECYTNGASGSDVVLYYNDPHYTGALPDDHGQGVFTVIDSPRYIMLDDLADSVSIDDNSSYIGRTLYLNKDFVSDINDELTRLVIYFAHVNRVEKDGHRMRIRYCITIVNNSSSSLNVDISASGGSVGWAANTITFGFIFYNNGKMQFTINAGDRQHLFLCMRLPIPDDMTAPQGGCSICVDRERAVPIPFDYPFDGMIKLRVFNRPNDTTPHPYQIMARAYIDWGSIERSEHYNTGVKDIENPPGNKFGDTENTFNVGTSMNKIPSPFVNCMVVGRRLSFAVDSSITFPKRLGVRLFGGNGVYYSKWITNQANSTKSYYYPNSGRTKNLVNCVYGDDIIPIHYQKYNSPGSNFVKNTNNSDWNNMGVIYTHPFEIRNISGKDFVVQICVGMTRITPGGPCQSGDTRNPEHPCIQPIMFSVSEASEAGTLKTPKLIKVNCSMGTVKCRFDGKPMDCERTNVDPNSLYPIKWHNFSNWPERVVYSSFIPKGETKIYVVRWALGDFSWGGIEHYIEIVDPGQSAPYRTGYVGDAMIMPETARLLHTNAVNEKDIMYVYKPRHAARSKPLARRNK